MFHEVIASPLLQNTSFWNSLRLTKKLNKTERVPMSFSQSLEQQHFTEPHGTVASEKLTLAIILK